ncbi:unnamed protein product, partial [Dicrocoelium dendriticum]
MDSTATNAAVSELRQTFSRFGCPETIVTDNGTQFTSATFTEFCRKCAVQYVRSPPFHPQSNGQAERFVNRLKRALYKSKGEGRTEEVVDQFLFLHRSTPDPQAPDRVSPAQAMMNRKLRVPFVAIRPCLEPSVGERNCRIEKDFNRRHGAKKRSFTLGQILLVRDYREDHAKWTPWTVKKQARYCH